jgi:hypothetical protein
VLLRGVLWDAYRTCGQGGQPFHYAFRRYFVAHLLYVARGLGRDRVQWKASRNGGRTMWSRKAVVCLQASKACLQLTVPSSSSLGLPSCSPFVSSDIHAHDWPSATRVTGFSRSAVVAQELANSILLHQLCPPAPPTPSTRPINGSEHGRLPGQHVAWDTIAGFSWETRVLTISYPGLGKASLRIAMPLLSYSNTGAWIFLPPRPSTALH